MMTKLAIVTGAGQGIGEGIAHRLAKDGYAVAVADINQRTAKKVAKDLKDAGFKAKAYYVDVAHRDEVFDLVKTAVKDLGELAAFINNAGVAFIDSFVNSRPNDVERLLDVNLKGTYWGVQAAAEQFIKQGHGVGLSTQPRWPVLKPLPCKAPTQPQNLVSVVSPNPRPKNWQNTKSLSMHMTRELSAPHFETVSTSEVPKLTESPSNSNAPTAFRKFPWVERRRRQMLPKSFPGLFPSTLPISPASLCWSMAV